MLRSRNWRKNVINCEIKDGKLMVEVPITDQFLKDVLCTIVESGYSTQWARFKNAEMVEGKHCPDYVSVRVEDWGDEDKAQSSKHIDLLTLRDALPGLISGTLKDDKGNDGNVHETYRQEILESLMADDAGEIDAWRADMILQAAYFGAVIYG